MKFFFLGSKGLNSNSVVGCQYVGGLHSVLHLKRGEKTTKTIKCVSYNSNASKSLLKIPPLFDLHL